MILCDNNNNNNNNNDNIVLMMVRTEAKPNERVYF